MPFFSTVSAILVISSSSSSRKAMMSALLTVPLASHICRLTYITCHGGRVYVFYLIELGQIEHRLRRDNTENDDDGECVCKAQDNGLSCHTPRRPQMPCIVLG